MKLQYLDPGVEGDNDSGTFLPDAAAIINDDFEQIGTSIAELLGSGSTGVLAGVGDSIVGYLPGIINEVIATHYNPDLYMRAEFQCSAPGRKSDFILSDMVPKLQAAITLTGIIPRGCIVTGGQNDGVVRLDIAQATFANLIAIVQAVRAMGVPVVGLMGMLPDPKLKGAGRPAALDWLNTALRNWAAGQEGVRFINILPLVKDQTGRGEAQTQVVDGNTVSASAVWWKTGVDATGMETVKEGNREQIGLGGSGSAGIDNEHFAPFGGRLAAPAFARFLKSIAPEMELPDLAPSEYDKDFNPLGNYLGSRGLYYGTGGTINGAASANIPAGWALNYDAAKLGSIVTPSIVVDDRGNRRFRLAGNDGAPTGTGLISLETTLNGLAPAGEYMAMARVRRRAMSGFAGVSLYASGGSLGSSGDLWNVLPFAIDDDILLRSLGPIGFENSGYNGKLFKWEVGYVAGIPLKGSIEFYRTSFYRVG